MARGRKDAAFRKRITRALCEKMYTVSIPLQEPCSSCAQKASATGREKWAPPPAVTKHALRHRLGTKNITKTFRPRSI